jgi:hypothetical protein
MGSPVQLERRATVADFRQTQSPGLFRKALRRLGLGQKDTPKASPPETKASVQGSRSPQQAAPAKSSEPAPGDPRLLALNEQARRVGACWSQLADRIEHEPFDLVLGTSRVTVTGKRRHEDGHYDLIMVVPDRAAVKLLNSVWRLEEVGAPGEGGLRIIVADPRPPLESQLTLLPATLHSPGGRR